MFLFSGLVDVYLGPYTGREQVRVISLDRNKQAASKEACEVQSDDTHRESVDDRIVALLQACPSERRQLSVSRPRVQAGEIRREYFVRCRDQGLSDGDVCLALRCAEEAGEFDNKKSKYREAVRLLAVYRHLRDRHHAGEFAAEYDTNVKHARSVVSRVRSELLCNERSRRTVAGRARRSQRQPRSTWTRRARGTRAGPSDEPPAVVTLDLILAELRRTRQPVRISAAFSDQNTGTATLVAAPQALGEMTHRRLRSITSKMTVAADHRADFTDKDFSEFLALHAPWLDENLRGVLYEMLPDRVQTAMKQNRDAESDWRREQEGER